VYENSTIPNECHLYVSASTVPSVTFPPPATVAHPVPSTSENGEQITAPAATVEMGMQTNAPAATMETGMQTTPPPPSPELLDLDQAFNSLPDPMIDTPPARVRKSNSKFPPIFSIGRYNEHTT